MSAFGHYSSAHTDAALLRALMEHLPDAIYFKDLNGRFTAVNRAMAQQCGFRGAEEMIGKDEFALFDKEHAQRSLDDEQEIIRTGTSILGKEEEAACGGGERWVSITKLPLRDDEGKIIGTFGISRDVTPLKEMEHALTNERNLLRSVIEHLPDPIYVKDRDGRYLVDNSAHRGFLGAATVDEVVGKTSADFFPADVAGGFHSADQSVADSGEPLVNQEEYVPDAKGVMRWFLTTKVPLRDERGALRGIIGIGRDITEAKQAREQLAAVAEELRAKNEALEKDLATARDLQSAMLPQRYPAFPPGAGPEHSALHFCHFFNPSTAVSGDFFDVLEISDTSAGVFICDVMGHGVRAAMIAAIIGALIGELKHLWDRPAELLSELNRALRATLQSRETPIFASAFHLVADLDKGELCYANAGHPHPLRVNPGASDPQILECAGPVLGIFDRPEYSECRSALSPHDMILLFTDGLFEVEGSHGQTYDYPRLLEAVGARSKLSASEICRGIVDEVREFSASHHFDDDVCLVAVEVDHLIRAEDGRSRV